jgi:hypothetical protein
MLDAEEPPGQVEGQAWRWLRPLNRPLGNESIDVAHDADGPFQGDDDLLVVEEVIEGQLATLTILEPLVEDLVAADLEFPDLGLHGLKVLSRVDVDATLRDRIRDSGRPPAWGSLETALQMPTRRG